MPKTRVLVLCSRGVNHQDRHLTLDMRQIIPHSKKECKFDKKDSLIALNEICVMDKCDKCLYFENRKGKLLYMWASNINGGPSVKFLVQGVHTMSDIKFCGNSLKGSRPILTFDPSFDKVPHLRLIKELFLQIFNVPYKHPKSQPFVDRVVTFSYLDEHIWFRNYQIVDQTDLSKLEEIGPRMVLQPMLILSASFRGKVIWAGQKKNTKEPPQSRAESGDSNEDGTMDDVEDGAELDDDDEEEAEELEMEEDEDDEGDEDEEDEEDDDE